MKGPMQHRAELQEKYLGCQTKWDAIKDSQSEQYINKSAWHILNPLYSFFREYLQQQTEQHIDRNLVEIATAYYHLFLQIESRLYPYLTAPLHNVPLIGGSTINCLCKAPTRGTEIIQNLLTLSVHYQHIEAGINNTRSLKLPESWNLSTNEIPVVLQNFIELVRKSAEKELSFYRYSPATFNPSGVNQASSSPDATRPKSPTLP